jgi:hypothetical protein
MEMTADDTQVMIDPGLGFSNDAFVDPSHTEDAQNDSRQSNDTEHGK